jgi:hypothetical protein
VSIPVVAHIDSQLSLIPLPDDDRERGGGYDRYERRCKLAPSADCLISVLTAIVRRRPTRTRPPRLRRPTPIRRSTSIRRPTPEGSPRIRTSGCASRCSSPRRLRGQARWRRWRLRPTQILGEYARMGKVGVSAAKMVTHVSAPAGAFLRFLKHVCIH